MRNARILVSVFVVLILAAAPVAAAQEKPQESPRPIGLQDILNWKSIRGASLSEDGRWFLYQISPQEGESEVVIRMTKEDKLYRFPIGEVSGSAAAGFSSDAKWAAFLSYPGSKETASLRKARKRITTKVVLVDLADGEETTFDGIRRFAFSAENPGFLALHRFPSEAQEKESEKWSGSDLILRDLKTEKEWNIGNVSEYAFDEKGKWLATIIDAQGQSGNGIQLRNLATGAVSSLDNDKASYKSLTWTDEGEALAALKGTDDDNYEDKLYSIVAYTGFQGTQGLKKIVYIPQEDKTFPEGMTISPNRSPRWTENLDAIIFGIHEVKTKKDADAKKAEEGEETEDEPPAPPRKPDTVADEDIPDLVIWHWKDTRLQSMQQVQEQRDKNFNYLAIFRVNEKAFLRLADDSLRDVTIAPKDMWAIGTDVSVYELAGNLDGRRYRDIYVIDLKTGERRRALEKSRWFYGPSPDGTHLLYYKDGHFHTYEMASGKSTNITKDVPASFIDTEDDHNVIDPPRPTYGWVKDGVSVLLSDGWDIWNVPVKGGEGVNLTVDGEENAIRYGRPIRLDPDEEGVDLDGPVYLSIYGEWTKKGGIALIDKGKPGAAKLLWDDAVFSSLMKAKKAETYLFTKQTYKDYPEYYVTGVDLKAGAKITDTNPQQKDILWSSGSLLVDYTSAKGDKLQAALFLPANYVEGKAYPTVVYIYEKNSQNLNRYYAPSPYSFNKSVYTSHGYAVLMPDIVYKINDPGMSSVWCVLPALEAAIGTGVVDKDKVGLQGHSWGGYQSSFLATQTDAFAAIVTGAPLTNMISMYSSIYWNSGSANQPIFESSQGRFYGGYWDNLEAYTRNSPVYFAGKVTTPMVILHNDNDGAVDWNQGIEYFNTLRRLKKPVVMLQYVGENHGLRKPANRKDYGVRMKEFFDHYLMGKPAPKWWLEGVSHLDLQDHLKERAKDLKLVEKVEKKEKKDPEKK